MLSRRAIVGCALALVGAGESHAKPPAAILGRWRDQYGHEFVFLPSGRGEAYSTPNDHLQRDPTVVSWVVDGDDFRIHLQNEHAQTFFASVRGDELQLTPDRPLTFFTVITYHRVATAQ